MSQERNLIKEHIFGSDDYFKSLIADVENALKTIDLETYIYCDDLFGSELSDALVKAAERGVKIRVLVDGAGTSWNKCLGKMEKAGIAVRFFHPFPWNIWQRKHTNFPSSIFYNTIYLFTKINSRNHRKTCIIDNQIVYIGSANVTQKHLSKEYGGESWFDTIVRLTNLDTTHLQYAFDIAWHRFSLNERLIQRFQKVAEDPIFRLNYSRHHRRILYKFLLKKILAAKHRIWVTSAYFNPNYFLLRGLSRAAKRGIDVKIILTQKSDIIFMPLVATTFYTRLLKANIQIYEFMPNILHSKIIIIDDWFCVGSSNFNQRSLKHDLEVDVNIQTPEAKKIIEKQFLENIEHSRKITNKDIEKQPLYKRWLSQLILFLNYFL